jgi:competence protein ComFC
VARLLDLLFPPTCPACRSWGWPLCGRCTERVGVITPPWCQRCGRPWEEALRSCADCPPRGIDLARAPFLYDGPIAAAIRGMKFSGWHALGEPFAAAMAEAWDGRADVVTWVPLSRRRRARRGFDQAELLARAVAARRDLPVVPLLRRVRDTRPQARRGADERRRALDGAFRAVADAPARVLLVDDVLTTGSTAAACAATLHDAGARTVLLLTAARTVGDPVPRRCFGDPRWKHGRLGLEAARPGR